MKKWVVSHPVNHGYKVLGPPNPRLSEYEKQVIRDLLNELNNSRKVGRVVRR